MARVLVVEDHEDSARFLCKLLALKGHVCAWVGDGREAIAAITREVPDVVMLDLQMPCMDGVEFLDVLRGYARWRSIPVVLVTGADDVTISKALPYGVFRVLRKGGFEFTALLSAVTEASPQGQADRAAPL